MAIKHAFVSAKTDGGDATLVRPSNWNEAHTLEPTIEIVQVSSGTTGNTSPRTLTFPSALTPGNIVYVGTGASTNVDITPSATDVTFTNMVVSTNGTTAESALWKGVIGASPGTTVTLTRASGTAFFGGWAIELSGTTGTLVSSTTHGAARQVMGSPAFVQEEGNFMLAGVGAASGTDTYWSPNFTTGHTSNFVFFGYRPYTYEYESVGAIIVGNNTSVWAAFTAAIS